MRHCRQETSKSHTPWSAATRPPCLPLMPQRTTARLSEKYCHRAQALRHPTPRRRPTRADSRQSTFATFLIHQERQEVGATHQPCGRSHRIAPKLNAASGLALPSPVTRDCRWILSHPTTGLLDVRHSISLSEMRCNGYDYGCVSAARWVWWPRAWRMTSTLRGIAESLMCCCASGCRSGMIDWMRRGI